MASIQTYPQSVPTLKIEKEGRLLTLAEFEKTTGAKFLPQLEFGHFSLVAELSKQCAKLHKKGGLTRQQVWFGKYYQKELLSQGAPPLSIRWVDESIGWGVFIEKDLRKMDFICEYTGVVRRRKRTDKTNSYCFEYLISQGEESPYVIDAAQQGGVSRYINHSSRPNLLSVLCTFDNITHIVLVANEDIPKGTQLSYDYGPNYWLYRPKPLPLI